MKLYLQTCDGSIQQVEQEIAMFCPFICQEILQKGMGFSESSAICLPKEVSSAMLNSILEYCQFHRVRGCSDKERKLFDEKFVTIPTERLYELASAANSLKLRSLVELTCRAIARTLERSSPEEICDTFNLPKEKLEPFINITCNPSIGLLDRLKRNKLKERGRVLENVGVQEKEEHVVDERPIDELLSFINGSNDGETKEKKTGKNIIKNKTKKKHQQKNSSLTSSNSLSA
ncbi:SKP1-like protein 21 [Medicago truncatula]|nr:SKP1-like protein 21 [Medicago truncatula]